MRNTFTLFLLLVCGSRLFAGNVEGTITTDAADLKETAKQVAVWIEGIEGFQMPETNPVLSQQGIQFSPRMLMVTAGQTVDMPNDDDVAHNVFSLSKAKKFKLGIYPKGQSRSVTFEKPGVIDLFCSIHRHMHAVVVVTPSPHSAVSSVGSAFSIKDVPPGSYTLHYWNAKLGKHTQPLETTDDVTNVTIKLPADEK